eukprot:1662344-Pleurochrysis_carterae.AAC.1
MKSRSLKPESGPDLLFGKLLVLPALFSSQARGSSSAGGKMASVQPWRSDGASVNCPKSKPAEMAVFAHVCFNCPSQSCGLYPGRSPRWRWKNGNTHIYFPDL